ncbi:T9SS type A sorting domain-containing protein [Owenweeksia hongkongensis]|uniref:T9SS type A sorting domain-containing protein n=1 Tax=Owenweeksia hongkongensis TaxID=253245 RepID=UPI003A937CD8
MKKLLFLLFVSFMAVGLHAQTSHTIAAVGVEYSPDTIIVNLGDTIIFDVGNSHPTTQVDLATYNSNGSTALSGGFSFPSGQGSFVASTLGAKYYICDNHISQGMKGMIMVNPTVGVSEVHLGNHTLYPNPVESELHINLSAPQDVFVYSLDGKVVKRFENVTETINVTELNAGTYILVLGEGENIERIRFMKK